MIKEQFISFLSPAPKIRPYTVSLGRDNDNYFEQVRANYAPYVNSFRYYEDLIRGLKDISDLKLMPLCELAKIPAGDKRARYVGLRHDIDADPVTGLKASEFLTGLGLRGSFFLLHTSPYYGDFHNGVFVRNAKLSEWIFAFVASGCELGLHNDAWGVYCREGVDGAQAFLQELHWLREHGALVEGTVAHNSAPVYGAENYEIFSEMVLWPRSVAYRGNKKLPLGSLSMKKLGLTYEGTFAVPRKNPDLKAASRFCSDLDNAGVRSREWMRRYLLENPCCGWSVDYQFWLVGRDQWVAAGRSGNDVLFDWMISGEQMMRRVSALPAGSRSVLLVHPEYVSGAKE